ncbi:hypothetical protein niasHT_023205 [Heterodera trifolii]|uniref:KASH domain-containing protein n=1 Tax=Heterodera trifolii TaxID=157864 RepID=A0ABD2JDD3_9BILA
MLLCRGQYVWLDSNSPNLHNPRGHSVPADSRPLQMQFPHLKIGLISETTNGRQRGAATTAEQPKARAFFVQSLLLRCCEEMNGSPANFSKNEKAFEPMAEVQLLKDDDQLVVEERCSALWNEIKDAGVLDGAELSNAFLAQLQSESDQLDEQVQKLAQKSETLAANAQLRLCSVWTALEELKRKKQRIAGEMGDFHHHSPQIGTLRLIDSFRKWLKQKEAQQSQVKQRIAHSHDSESSLRELEQEQLALQENIETEGRTKHQQLCNNSSRSSKNQNKRQKDVDKVISDECAQLEQRYLALWLASLESLELIHHFSARFLKNCPEELFDSELEVTLEEQPKDEEKEEEKEKEGPKAKRRKTNEEEKGGGGEEMEQYEQNNSNGTKTEAEKCHQKDDQPQHQLTDIGYSSGENTSVHEGGTNTTVSEEMAEEEAEGGGGKAGESGGERVEVRDEFMLVDNSELEKSFYRTVPLDEFGQTDLDTDEGNWPRSTYWAQRFMEEVEKTGTGKDRGTIDLTDSLIVHVDGPESRERLNDFEGLVGLEDGRRFVDPFIEDECESQSTDEWNDGGRTRRSHPSSSTTTRKRTLTRTLLLPTIWTDRTVPAGKAKSRQSPRGTRRKCAAVRKTRSSTEGMRERATNWTRWPNLSSDFEWDDEGYRRTSRDEEMSTEKGGDEEAIAIARKKALRSFRDSLFKAATQSGHVNVRLQELLALVDKSLGGVDSASFLLVELNNTFTALSNLCRKLEQKMGGESVNGEKKVQEMDILKEDMEAELLLCHERMNALETTCNNLALLLGGHLSGSESNKSCALEADEKGDYLAQFANECSRIRKELQKLKKRFDRKLVFCCLNKVPFAEDKENSGGKWKNRSADQIVECAIQSSALASVRPVPSPFWRSYLLLCLFGLIVSFGALLFATSRDGTDWRWTFGPQLNYERGAPPF